MKKVIVELQFDPINGDPSPNASIEGTQDVPLTIILESLINLTKGMAQIICNDARNVVSEAEMQEYLDARIKVDKNNFYQNPG